MKDFRDFAKLAATNFGSDLHIATIAGEITMLSNEQIDHIFELSKDDRMIIVGSEIRQLCAQAKLAPTSAELPEPPHELIDHLDLHTTEHDNHHAGLALRFAWPAVKDYIKALRAAASGLISENQRLKETNGEITLEFCKQMDAQIALTSAAEASAQSALARVGELERDAAVGRAIDRAAKDLPENYEIYIELERGAGTVRLFLPDETTRSDFDDSDSFASQINKAIDCALKA